MQSLRIDSVIGATIRAQALDSVVVVGFSQRQLELRPGLPQCQTASPLRLQGFTVEQHRGVGVLTP